MNWLSLLLAIGLGILWIFGLVSENTPAWMDWLVFLAALVALANAIAGPRTLTGEGPRRRLEVTP